MSEKFRGVWQWKKKKEALLCFKQTDTALSKTKDGLDNFMNFPFLFLLLKEFYWTSWHEIIKPPAFAHVGFDSIQHKFSLISCKFKLQQIWVLIGILFPLIKGYMVFLSHLILFNKNTNYTLNIHIMKIIQM